MDEETLDFYYKSARKKLGMDKNEKEWQKRRKDIRHIRQTEDEDKPKTVLNENKFGAQTLSQLKQQALTQKIKFTNDFAGILQKFN